MNKYLNKIFKKHLLLNAIVFVLVFGCSSNVDNFDGYYYNPEKFEIYFFNDFKVEIFKFSDSTKNKVNFDVEKDMIKIDDEIYNYVAKRDTIVLNNISEDAINLKLVKLDFKPSNLKKIVSKSFKMHFRRKDREFDKYVNDVHFLKMDKSMGFQFFYHRGNNIDTVYNGYIDFKGMIFDKFPFYKGNLGSAIIMYNSDNDRIKFLSDNGRNISEFVLTKFTQSSKPNRLLFGTWKQIEDKYNIDIFKQYANSYPTDSSYEDYKERLGTIKNEYDLSSIKFTEDGVLQRFYKSNTTINHQIKFGITDKYIFVEKFYDNTDFGVFKLEKLTKDTLVFGINNTQLKYLYIRDN